VIRDSTVPKDMIAVALTSEVNDAARRGRCGLRDAYARTA
jgi:hypothetical protein